MFKRYPTAGSTLHTPGSTCGLSSFRRHPPQISAMRRSVLRDSTSPSAKRGEESGHQFTVARHSSMSSLSCTFGGVLQTSRVRCGSVLLEAQKSLLHPHHILANHFDEQNIKHFLGSSGRENDTKN